MSAITRRQLATNAFAGIIQVVLTGGILFELYRFLNRHLGVAQIGVWSLVLASTALGRVADLGLGAGVVKFVAGHLAKNERQLALSTIQIALAVTMFVIGTVCLALYPAIYHVLGTVIPDPSTLQNALSILPYALATLFLGTLSAVVLSALDGCQRMDLRACTVVLGAVVQLMAAYWLVPRRGLVGLVVGQVLQGLTVLLVATSLLRHQLQLPILKLKKWEKSKFMQLLRYGVALQSAVIGQLLFEPVTKALISRFGGLELTGYYEMASRMVLQLRSLIVSAYQSLVPYVAGSITERARLLHVYVSSYHLLFFVVVTYYASIAMVVPFILRVWLGRYEWTFLLIAELCLVGWAINTLITPAYFIYLATGRLKWPVAAHVTIGILSAVLGAISGHYYGGLGVVVTTTIVLSIGSHIVSYTFHRELGVSLSTLLPKESIGLCVGGILSAICITLMATAYGEAVNSITTLTFTILMSGTLLIAWLNPNRKILAVLVHEVVQRGRA